MRISKEEAREIRRMTSILGQREFLSEEMPIQQALQEGLSIVTNPKHLYFKHTNQIYFKPELESDGQ